MKENKMMCDRQKECLACTNRSCMMAGIEDPKLGEECGVFGMYDMDGGDVASSIYYGLFSLQHRGQESCGIAVSRTDGEKRNSQMIKGIAIAAVLIIAGLLALIVAAYLAFRIAAAIFEQQES